MMLYYRLHRVSDDVIITSFSCVHLPPLCAMKLRVSLMQKELCSPMGLGLISLSTPEEEHSKGRCVVAINVPWVFMYVAVYD